jgi:hypothetical protein
MVPVLSVVRSIDSEKFVHPPIHCLMVVTQETAAIGIMLG